MGECKYCCEGRTLNGEAEYFIKKESEFFGADAYVGLKMYANSLEFLLEIGGVDAIGESIPINYCPVCGKKLLTAEESEEKYYNANNK
jgi:hypothetical protein